MRNAVASVLMAGCLAVLSPGPIVGPTAAQDDARRLSHSAGDVWRFQNKFHFSVVIDTEEGVIVTDPISPSAAAWLDEIIASRFAKPVIHLVYSHSHLDSASGGRVFADTATVIAHQNAPAEIHGVVPDYRFSERMTLSSGDHTIELTYLGPGHGTDLTAMVIRPENVAFVVDLISPGRIGYKDFPGVDIGDMIDQIKMVESLDFEILAPGNGRLGTKADLVAGREYLEWLRDTVAAEIKAGKSVDQVVSTLDTSAYSNLLAYDVWRDLNIHGMARWLKESGRVP